MHEVKGTPEKDKAILAHIGVSVQEWLQQAYENKARHCIDRLCTLLSSKQSGKMLEEEKMEIVRSASIEEQSFERQAKSLEERMKKNIS